MSSLGFDLTTPDDTLVGSASSLEAAASLAGAIYGRTGFSVRVEDMKKGKFAAWVGQNAIPPEPEVVFAISAGNDVADGMLIHFTISGADAATDVDFGDGKTASVPVDEITVDHSYVTEDIYHVRAKCGQKKAEVYATASIVS